jgi:hypothetical protein
MDARLRRHRQRQRAGQRAAGLPIRVWDRHRAGFKHEHIHQRGQLTRRTLAEQPSIAWNPQNVRIASILDQGPLRLPYLGRPIGIRYEIRIQRAQWRLTGLGVWGWGNTSVFGGGPLRAANAVPTNPTMVLATTTPVNKTLRTNLVFNVTSYFCPRV